MGEALKEAQAAFDEGEVPVGAVVVLDNAIIGRGHNRTEGLQDPTGHAEIIALSAAANSQNNWRLAGATVYSTVEPCVMCTGALVLSRVKRLVFGCRDEKFGGCGSVLDIPMTARLNHRFEVRSGVRAEETARLLKEFFIKQRKANASNDGE